MTDDPAVRPPASAEVLARIRDAKSGASPIVVPIIDYARDRVVGRAEALARTHVTDDLVERFVRWRNQNRGGWLDQRMVDVDGTRRWLDRYLERPDMLLYLLYAGDILVGRTGFLDLEREGFMVDGLVRGERGGGMHFIHWVGIATAMSDFAITHARWVDAKMLADNEFAISQSDAVGYRTYDERPLFRHEDERGVLYTEDPRGGAPTDRILLYRRVLREVLLESIQAQKVRR